LTFTVPNRPDVSFADQAELDAQDFAIIAAGFAGTYVQSGCLATQRAAGANMSVDVASGVIVINNVVANVGGGNVVITAADATNPRFDLIVSSAAGALTALAGTPSSNPVFPSFNPATQVPIAIVYVPATQATITTTLITQKQIIRPPHDQTAHTGDVVPDGQDTALGTATLKFNKRAASGVSTVGMTAGSRKLFVDDFAPANAGTGLIQPSLPHIAVKDSTGITIPLEDPLGGFADYVIIYDGTNYYAKNWRTKIIDYVSNVALNYVVNPVAASFGTGNGYQVGGSIFFAHPFAGAGNVMFVERQLEMYSQQTWVGSGMGTIISTLSSMPTGAINSNVDIPASSPAVFNAYSGTTKDVNRVRLMHFAIDLQSRTNSVGVIAKRGGGATGGADSYSLFYDLDILAPDDHGFMLGKSAGAEGATSNAFIDKIHAHGGTANSVGMGIYVGDAHVGGSCNIVSSMGYALKIMAAPVQVVGPSHFGFQNSNNLKAPVWIETGGAARLVGVYIDNVNGSTTAGVYVKNSSKVMVLGTWFNAGATVGGNGGNANLGGYGVVLDGSDSCLVAACHGEGNNGNAPAGPNNVISWSSIVNIINGSTMSKVVDNGFRYCKNVYTGARPEILHDNSVFWDASNIQSNFAYLRSDAEGASSFAASANRTVNHGLDRTPLGVLLTGGGTVAGVLEADTFGGVSFRAHAAASSSDPFYWRAFT
jgi:hypothetical protein